MKVFNLKFEHKIRFYFKYILSKNDIDAGKASQLDRKVAQSQ